MKILFNACSLLLLLSLAACDLGSLPTIPPGWTLTPEMSATPKPLPSPTITATPAPVIRVEDGEQALFNGDFPGALTHFQTAFQDSSDPLVQAAAKWGEARAYYGDERFDEARSALETITTEYPDSIHAPAAYYLLGSCQYKLEEYEPAAKSWQTYLTLRPGILDSYIQELRGDALFLAGSYTDALSAYTAAIQSPRLDDTAMLDIKAADTRGKLGDYETAQAVYEGILARQVNDYIKAQAVFELGLVLLEQGRTEEAYGKFRFAMENYPFSSHSYLGLLKLVDAEAEVDDLSRGLVDYFAGQYDGALAAFDRYLAVNHLNDGTAVYYRGLTLKALGNPEAAVTELSNFINNYPTHQHWVVAWEDKAETQWQDRGLSTGAAQTYTNFVDLMPTSLMAPDYLMRAARILETDGLLDEAAGKWERVANDFPSNDQAPTAIFLAGIVRYRQQKYEEALAAFNRSLSTGQQPVDRARAYLWIGKTHEKSGDHEAAHTAWLQGQIADPGGYYSERAREILADEEPFKPNPGSINFPDVVAERASADAWLRLTFNLPADTDLNGPGSLAEDPRYTRGTEFWQLGLYEEASQEFENLRAQVSTDPVASYRLANYLLDLGLYYTAIFAARETLTLAGLDEHAESMLAPPYFSHFRYGLYYSDLIIPAAQEDGFDPLLIFSVVRQESLFKGFVKSTQGARGLMQILPGTGMDISNKLGWPIEFNEDDLYRPDVSIKLGTHYLASNKNSLDGDLFGALAAYNAGPGFAVTWKRLAGGDGDLFLEIIRFSETRDYIRNINEIYSIYKRMYGQTGG
jgi:soluble lytic murein transglycosylase